MSSTGRGTVKMEADYYRTDPDEIRKFLNVWIQRSSSAKFLFQCKDLIILDPCAGGNTVPINWVMKRDREGNATQVVEIPVSGMSYPIALNRSVVTMDIRPDSPAKYIRDYLNDPCPTDGPPEIIISNPPFSHAWEFIKHSLKIVSPSGFVVMLLRLNFFGSKQRNEWFRNGNMPHEVYIHSKRLSFTPDGKTDSIEYMHAVWDMSQSPALYSKTYVLPY